jgi:hypothetical protein
VGWLGQKWGGPTTPFLAKGWLEPPLRPVWGWSNHPMAKGVVRPPPKAQKKKKKQNKVWVLAFWGWPDHPLGHGVVRPPPDRLWGWLQPPLGQKWGGRSHPPWPSHPPISFPLFFLGFWGWPDHPLGQATPRFPFPPLFFFKKKKLKFYNIFHFF